MTTVMADAFAGIPNADDAEAGEYSPVRVAVRDLQALTDEQLAHAWCRDGADAEALRAEEARRQHLARTRRRQSQAEWYDAAHEQFLAAEAACHGVLLNHRGIARGIEPWSLWTGSPWAVDAYASWELQRFWEDHPRITMTGYQRQQRRDREAMKDDYLDRDAGDPVRRGACQGQAGAGSGGDGRGHAVPGPAARTAPAQASAPARADAGRGAAVRSGRPVSATAARLHAMAAEIRAGTPRAASEPVNVAGHAEVAVREPGAVAVTRTMPDAAELLPRVLEGIGLLLTDYVAFPSRSAVIAVVLWIAQAAARDGDGELAWRAYPRLLVTSRQNGSGKSTLGDLASMLLACRAGRMSKVTPYGLTKVLGKWKEAAIADDAQNVFRSDKAGTDLLTIMINGYTPRATWVTGKDDGKIESACGPVMVIGKDELITKRADYLRDLLDRSVTVRMERPSRYMPEVGEDAESRAVMLAGGLKAVMGALLPHLREAARDLERAGAGLVITDGDGGRTRQIWRPMEAVAAVAGGRWPEAAAQARAELSAAAGDLLETEDALAEMSAAADGRSFWDEA